MSLLKHQRRFKDVGIGGLAARWYDGNTRKNRLGEMRMYADIVSEYVNDGSHILEVAPGPGYLAMELAKLGKCNEITGLDISEDFVQIAKENAQKAGIFEKIKFLQGNVANIPINNNEFDFIICVAALKNFKKPLAALEEMYRVLKPEGTALIVDMNRDVSDRQIEEYLKSFSTKGIGKAFMKLIFKNFLKSGSYTKDEFVDLISNTEFKHYRIEEKDIGFYIYLTKCTEHFSP